MKCTQIKAGDTGFGYSTVFGPCLDNNITDVTVQDPYIKAKHQVIKLFNKTVTKLCERSIRMLTHMRLFY